MLSLGKGHHLRLRYHPPLFHISNDLILRLLQVIFLLTRRRWMSYYSRTTLNHQLVVLAFTPIYLWFVSILVIFDPWSIVSNIIATCTCLLLTCLPGDRYGNFWRHSSDRFFLISGRFSHLGWLQALQFSLNLLKSYYFFVDTRVFILWYI